MAQLPFLLISAFLFYVQATLARMTDFCPDIGPVLAVYLGLFARRERIGIAALLLGLLRASLDLEPAAAIVLLYLAVAQAVVLIREVVYTDRMVSQWIVTFAGTALYTILYRIASLALPMGAASGNGMMGRLAVATLGATLVAPLIMSLLRVLRVGP